ncbi:MAG: glycosyltransferase family 9 protein, partial [Candidatus Lindowbacteria bacterium]|nr:glycosyltransferase family 9 protein [Candidatus Lindowbacteria bacterium]
KVCEQSSAELAPKTTFAELGACFSAARLLVSGETGPLHLAAAVGCPTVGLFGPTSSKRNGCHGEGHQIVEPELHCRPCYGRTCADFQCMPMIEVEQVYRAVEKLL